MLSLSYSSESPRSLRWRSRRKDGFIPNIEPETVSKLRPKRSKLSVAHERERERPSTASRPASSLSARRTE